MDFMTSKLMGILTVFISSVSWIGAETVPIPGQFGGRGEPVYETAKFGSGLRANTLHEGVLFSGCGNFRLDQGTVELWVRMIDDTKPGSGRVWRNLMSAPPLDDQFDGSIAQFSLGISTDHEKPYVPSSLYFASRAGKERQRVAGSTLDWTAGSDHYVAVTWGPRGLELFVDGQLTDRMPFTGKPYFDAVPSTLIFGNNPSLAYLFAKALIDEIKISDIQREPAYMEQAFRSVRSPEIDGNTLLLTHLDGSLDGVGRVTAWKKEQSLTILRTAWQCGLDPETDQGNIFLAGEAAVLRSFASRFAAVPESFTLECKVSDSRGKEVFSSSKTMELPSRCTNFELTAPLNQELLPGFYTARLILKGASGQVAESRQNFCLLDGVLPPGSMLWGFDVSDDYSSSMTALRRMGIGLLRGSGVYFWSFLEPQPGQFCDAPARAFSAAAAKNGIRVLGILGNTPLWAGREPVNMAAFAGGKNQEKAEAAKNRYCPRNIEEWSSYVTKTVTDNPQVKDWEIWNEPDWHLPQTQGFGFGGSTEQYFELLKTAFTAIKKIDPQLRVVFPGIACAATADPNFVRDLMRLGAIRYFDLLGMHPYGGLAFFQEQLALARQAGYRGSVWQTEYVPDCFLTEPFATRGRKMAVNQSRHIVRILPLGISAYVIHSTSYYFSHGQPTEGCFALAQLFRRLDHLAFVRSPAGDAYIFADDKRSVLVLWGSEPVRLISNAAKLVLTDSMGFRHELTATDGAVNFTPGDFLYVEAADGARIEPDSVRISVPRPDLRPVNGSFEVFDGDAGMGTFTPLNWELSSSHREGRLNVDLSVRRSGRGSLLLERPAGIAPGKIGVWQKLPGLEKGRRYLLNVWIKTGKVSPEPGSAMVTIWDGEKKKLYGGIFVSQNQPEFTCYSKLIELPADASDNVVIGCSLEGKIAKAWFDDLRFSLAPIEPQQLANTLFLNLLPVANRALGDNTVLQHSDAGQAVFDRCNLGRMITGVRIFGSELFRIETSVPAAVVLGGSAQSGLPREAAPLKVDAKVKTLNFLTTALFVTAKPGENIGEALVTYADGLTATIPFRRGFEVDDWYPPLVGSDVRVAEKVKVAGENDGERAVFLASWTNPHPGKKIATLMLRSSGGGVWGVLAVSGVF